MKKLGSIVAAIRIWRKMKGWGEGQVAWGLLNIKDELEEAYGNEFEIGGTLDGL